VRKKYCWLAGGWWLVLVWCKKNIADDLMIVSRTERENVRALLNMDIDTITEKILCCLNKSYNYDPPKHLWSQHEPQQRLALYRM